MSALFILGTGSLHMAFLTGLRDGTKYRDNALRRVALEEAFVAIAFDTQELAGELKHLNSSLLF